MSWGLFDEAIILSNRVDWGEFDFVWVFLCTCGIHPEAQTTAKRRFSQLEWPFICYHQIRDPQHGGGPFCFRLGLFEQVGGQTHIAGPDAHISFAGKGHQTIVWSLKASTGVPTL